MASPFNVGRTSLRANYSWKYVVARRSLWANRFRGYDVVRESLHVSQFRSMFLLWETISRTEWCCRNYPDHRYCSVGKCEDRNIMLLGRYEDQEVFLLQNCEAKVYRGQFAANMRSGITAYPNMLKFLEVPNFEIRCTTIFQQMIWVISNISKVFLNGIRATRVQIWSICLEDPEMSQQMLEYVPKL